MRYRSKYCCNTGNQFKNKRKMTPKKRVRLNEGQQTLLNIGFSCPTTEKNSETVKKETEQRNFQSKWLTLKPWLRYDPSKNVVTCNICIKAKKCNSFTKGNSNFKTSSLQDHLRSNDHKIALQVPVL